MEWIVGDLMGSRQVYSLTKVEEWESEPRITMILVMRVSVSAVWEWESV